jgi:hypothetical protein
MAGNSGVRLSKAATEVPQGGIDATLAVYPLGVFYTEAPCLHSVSCFTKITTDYLDKFNSFSTSH